MTMTTLTTHTTGGYYRYPALFGDQLVFVSEDQLWRTDAFGAPAWRLTSGLGTASTPVFSPDGQWIAFAGSDEGPAEVCLIPAAGGPVTRLTYLGEGVHVQSWTHEGIYFTSAAKSPFARVTWLWRVSPEGGAPTRLSLGPVNAHMLKDHQGPMNVIQRFGYREYGFWKRYRGGTAGTLWIDRKGEGTYAPLIELTSDMARPLWIGDRVYFASDHEGIGNLYSCTAEGTDLKRHTHHTDFYVRNQQTDGKRLVYHAGGELYLFDPEKDTVALIDPVYGSARPERARKFVAAQNYLEQSALHPFGHHALVTARGKPFVLERAHGPVLQLGAREGIRYRLPVWLQDGERVVLISDENGHEALEIHDAKTGQKIATSQGLDFGRARHVYPSPTDDAVIVVNQKGEIIHIDLESWHMRVLDRSAHEMVQGAAWSPDGKWVAYHCSLSRRQSAIKLACIQTGAVHQITKPVLKDTCPVFDPEGKYLYFLSLREFNPSWDSLHFELGFPAGMRPYALALADDTPSPFVLKAKDFDQGDEDESKESKEEDATAKKDGEEKEEADTKTVPEIRIDLEGIQDRLMAFPVEPGLFSHLAAIKGKVMYLSWPLVDAGDEDEACADHDGGALAAFDFESQKEDELCGNVSSFEVSLDGKRLLYQTGKSLRIIKAGDKPDEGSDQPAHKSGWIDLSRIKLCVTPYLEWPQIYSEAWRLQRDHFWVEDMSQVNWQTVYDRYAPLLDRISTRRELSDVIWEMQGELGTSHAYVMGGDLRPSPAWSVGQLGADFVFDAKSGAYQIVAMAKADTWRERYTSPLRRPGLGIKVGDLIWAVNGEPVSKTAPVEALLLQQAGQEVRLQISNPAGENKRDVVVKTLRQEGVLYYRDWVENNRAYVHEKTGGTVGYVHIPDMGTNGFAEFHRGFLAECDRGALIIDVRYNGGGSVSSLLLSKLARKRLGYDLARWFGDVPYPVDSSTGNLVALTNEYAGSDGDMFSHAFKMMDLGPLIGKRTWGGVIGIWPRNPLVDGGMTTQPEFSFWFKDVGWGLENYGAVPNIVVENTPQDYQNGRDPQLDRSIEEALKRLQETPENCPHFNDRPNLALPTALK